MPIVRDWKYNELVFYFPIINVLEVSEVEDFVNNFTPGKAQTYPANKRINLTELYNNPDKYYVLSFTTGAYIWNPKTEKYVANNNFQIMANIDTPNQSIGVTGIQNIVNLIKSQTFPYSGQSPYYVNLMFNAASTSQVAYGRNGYSEGIPKGLSTEYNYMLGYPSFEYKHTVIRNKIQQGLDDITNSASGATTVSEYHIEIEKIHEDEKSVMYSYPYVSGGTNADHSRQWLTTYQWKPVTFIKGSFFLKFVGSFGLYVTNDSSTYMSTATPETLSNTPDVYLGEMNSKGFTTGRLIPWTDLDEYEGFNKDGSSVNPGFDPSGGGGGGDDEDDPWDKINFGPGGGNLGVFAKFYLCTATDLANLRSWFAGGGHQQIPQGFDPMTQIIGLSQFATSVSGTAVDEAEITFRAADNTPVYTGVFCQRGSGADLAFDLGSIEIPLRMKDRGVPFLDYSSTVELYIPFCGAFQLDPQTVLGRTVAVRMWMSTTTGECFAIATADGSPVAYGSGIMNAEMPISSNGWGLYKASLTNTTNKFIGNALSEVGGIIRNAAEGAIAGAAVGSVVPGAGTAAGAGAGATIGVVTGLINAGVQGAKVGHTIGTGLTDYEHLKKSSTTSISGSLSSTAAWHQPFTPYIKITRPHYRKPDNYAHTQAIPLVATRTLSECAGLTMCIKTDLSGINATEYEKTVIASFLESGVIV